MQDNSIPNETPVAPGPHLVCLDALEAICDVLDLIGGVGSPPSLRIARLKLHQQLFKAENEGTAESAIRELANELADVVSEAQRAPTRPSLIDEVGVILECSKRQEVFVEKSL